MGRNGH
jgi:hypothetical protein